MTTFPNSPKIIKEGVAQFDPDSSQVKRVISLQISPESLNRSFQPGKVYSIHQTTKNLAANYEYFTSFSNTDAHGA